MDLEAFVRASGDVMGFARDSFGLNLGAGAGASTPWSSPMFAAPVNGSGQAATAANTETNVVNGQVSTLGQQNQAANAHLDGALTAAGAGHCQMDGVISAALADINCLAAATRTLTGQLALVNAVAARLEQTWCALTNGNTDASTRAASSAQLAAAYNGLGYPQTGGMATSPAAFTGGMSPMAAMAPMQMMPMLAAQSMAANQAAQSQAQQVAGMQQPSGLNSAVQNGRLVGAVARPGAPKQPIPPSAVKFIRKSFPGGKSAFVGYANQALNVMGINLPGPRNNWMKWLLNKANSESSYQPLAVNKWDSNAHGATMADGAPFNSSRGLLQTIPTTFAANHQPGTSANIYHPVANIAAAMNYVMGRYDVRRNGSNLGNVPQGGY
jgi:hypothetical protein